MTKKVHVTRTFAPLQFEALEPHRFEDLVRDLLYGFRDWQRIEATGRGGADDGFDIRAYEKTLRDTRRDTESDEDAETPLTVEGNLWMIQCKREKQLGASRIKEVIADAVDANDPPHGYVLAAPVNFTKKSYDAFRAALVDRGVSEFQLLGRGELEDMLYQPKNDRVLFAFFGVSLVSRKRSRTTELRSAVNNKNKLYKILGDAGIDFSANVLVRDTNDEFYPDQDKYPDFAEHPHWREYVACAHHTEGVRFHTHEYYAFVDQEKKVWDCVPTTDLLFRHGPGGHHEERTEEERDLRERIRDFWEHLPLWNQAKYRTDGLIRYRDFDLIDVQGDARYKLPHFYVDYGRAGPFDGYWEYLLRYEGRESIYLNDYRQESSFPKSFPKIKQGRFKKEEVLEAPSYLGYRLRGGGQHFFFDLDDKYASLKQRDVVGIPRNEDNKGMNFYAEVMYRCRTKISDLEKLYPSISGEIRQQAGKDVSATEEVTLFQLKGVYRHELDQSL